jgi:hypothetical protein
MRRCFVPRKRALVLALVLAFGGSAIAATLEQLGVAESAPASLQTYGVDVPVKTGLKSLLPDGWQIFVHRSAQLPETVSWSVGQTWTQALSVLAEKHGQAVLIDWTERAVYLRSPEVALEEGAKRAQIAQAATTPLPVAVAAPRTPLPLTASAPQSTSPSISTQAVAPAPTTAASATVASAQTEAIVAPPHVSQSDHVASSAVPSVASVPSAPAPSLNAAASSTGSALASQDQMAEGSAQSRSLTEPESSAEQARRQRMAAALDAATKVKVTQSSVTSETMRPALAASVPSAAKESHSPSATLQPVAVEAKPVSARSPVPGAPTFEPVPIRSELTRVEPASIPVKLAAVTQTQSAHSSTLVRARQVQPGVAPATGDNASQANVLNVASGTEARVKAPQGYELLGAASFNRAAVGDVLEHAARMHGYSVSFEAAEAHFPGPVTLLGTDMGEELRLMMRAFGPGAPVRFELYRDARVVRLMPAAKGTPEVAVMPQLYAGTLVARTPAPVVASQPTTLAATAGAPVAVPVTPTQTAATHANPAQEQASAAGFAVQAVPQVQESIAQTPQTSFVAAEPVRRAAGETVTRMEPESLQHAQPAPDESTMPDVPAPVSLSFVMREGDSLRDALETFLKEHGLQLKWTLKEDLQASWPVSLEGASVAAVLHALMPKLGLSADIYTPSSLVVVRAADAALDK